MDVATAVISAFLASLVEAVEALTIVLAVGTLHDWRPATIGSVAGIGVLAMAIILLGPLIENVPIGGLQVAIGMLLLLFGIGWLRKAILRAAGIVSRQDENAIYATESAQLAAAAAHGGSLAWIGGLAHLIHEGGDFELADVA